MNEYASDWLMIDFGEVKTFSRVELLIYDDRGGVQPPVSVAMQYWDNQKWRPVRNAQADPRQPTGNIANTIHFDPVNSSKVRAVFIHAGKARCGVTEFEVSIQ